MDLQPFALMARALSNAVFIGRPYHFSCVVDLLVEKSINLRKQFTNGTRRAHSRTASSGHKYQWKCRSNIMGPVYAYQLSRCSGPHSLLSPATISVLMLCRPKFLLAYDHIDHQRIDSIHGHHYVACSPSTRRARSFDAAAADVCDSRSAATFRRSPSSMPAISSLTL